MRSKQRCVLARGLCPEPGPDRPGAREDNGIGDVALGLTDIREGASRESWKRTASEMKKN